MQRNEVNRNSRQYPLGLAVGYLFDSTQLARESLGLQMRIPPQHAQVLVPGDARDPHDVQPLLEQPGRRFMAQVVEAEVFDAGLTYRTHVRKCRLSTKHS